MLSTKSDPCRSRSEYLRRHCQHQKRHHQHKSCEWPVHSGDRLCSAFGDNSSQLRTLNPNGKFYVIQITVRKVIVLMVLVTTDVTTLEYIFLRCSLQILL
jgi:hypothetical protein